MTSDVLIVGAGPHALTLSRYLAKAGIRPLVFDVDGWCERWRGRLERLDVRMLRSHHTQHPEPDQYALARFGGDPIQKWAGPWSTPTTDIFDRFCAHLIDKHALAHVLRRDRVVQIEQLEDVLRVRTQHGGEHFARRVVLATNPMCPLRPGWATAAAVRAPDGRLIHSDELDLRALALAGERVLVVGGGLTGAGIAVAAMQRGAHVTVAARRALELRVADAESNWHGPARLRPFFAEPDPVQRREMCRAARGGGTVTPPLAWALRKAAHDGTAELLEGHEVRHASWQDGAFSVLLDYQPRRFDRIWLATGHDVAVDAEPLLDRIASSHPARVVGGLPVLDSACRWPGTALHLMGALAELQLGPLARNLAGARMAADRIICAIDPLAAAEYPQPPRPPSNERPRVCDQHQSLRQAPRGRSAREQHACREGHRQA